MAVRILKCEDCGRSFTATRSDKRTCSTRCRKRLSRRNEATASLDERYELSVWDARRRGLLNPDEALLLLVAPSPTVLERLQAVAA